jgi:hypothetical protein
MRSAAPLSLNVSLLVGRQKIFVTCDIVVRLDDPPIDAKTGQSEKSGKNPS